MPGVFVNVVGLVWFRLNCCCVLLPHHPKVSNEKSVQQGMEGRMSQTKKKSVKLKKLKPLKPLKPLKLKKVKEPDSKKTASSNAEEKIENPSSRGSEYP